MACAAAIWVAWRATRPLEHPLSRLSVDLGPEALTGPNLTAVISADGRRIVYGARGRDGKGQLATRLLDQVQPTLMQGTTNGSDPFFSPDGQWVGFFADGKLKKVPVQGGAPVALCAAAYPLGASWGENGNIVLSSSIVGPLLQISEAGGSPRPLTRLRPGEFSHRWPQVVPGGSVLFTAARGVSSQEDDHIAVFSRNTGEIKTVQQHGYFGRYLPTGHLVFVHEGVLFGVRFDVHRLESKGTPIPLVSDMDANPVTGGGQFDFAAAASGTGTLLFLAGRPPVQSWQVAWLDSSGRMPPLISAPGVYSLLRFSPDGRKLALTSGVERGISIYDVERGVSAHLVKDNASTPVWTPNGRHIVFWSLSGGHSSLSWISADGASEPLRLLERDKLVVPMSFSPDGRLLAYTELDPETGFDMWILPLDIADPERPKPGNPQPLLQTSANEFALRFSPDGRWIAYRSDESGTNEIYVRPFSSGSSAKVLISTAGGLYPFWSNNGRQLFYEDADRAIRVVDYTVKGASFDPSRPSLWSAKQIFYSGSSNLDLAPDGKRFAVLAAPEPSSAEKKSVHVVMLENFFDEVKRRIR